MKPLQTHASHPSNPKVHRYGKLKTKFMRAASVTLFLTLTFSLATSTASAHDLAKQLTHAANLFVKSLEPKQQQSLLFEFDAPLRKDWQFIPMDRQGLGLKQLKPHQRLLAMSLIQTALSHRGYSQSLEIMALEQVLHEMENLSPKRDPEKYHLFFFGNPANDPTWGWRVEGHHLSISLTIVEGDNVVAAPVFFGTNPAEVRTGRLKGLRVLGTEEDLGRSLVKNLDVEQKRIAIVSRDAPKDIINGPGRKASRLEPPGIAASDMTERQRNMLMDIIQSFVNKLRPELSQSDLQRIKQAGIDQLHFAWAGKIQRGEPHYFRVQGPTFILEYDNTQNGANHAHAIWRDFQNDFGEDLLKKHYQQQHAEGKAQR